MKTEPLSACIVGVSGFGNTHYRDLMREVEAGRMRAVGATVRRQDRDREKCEALRSLGCELFKDHREMLAKFKGRVDLCFVPTGIHMHAPMSIDAMSAGADVFVEKPAAATVQDVRRMRECERRTSRFAAVGYQHMYASATMRLKEMILAGAVGAVRVVKCRALWPRADSYYERNSWAGRLKVGGDWVLDSPFNNALAHYLNLMCFFAGTERVRSARVETVEAELYRANDIESTDTACLRVTTAGGVRICFYVTHACENQLDPEIVVVGQRGRVTLSRERARIAPDGRARVRTDSGAPERRARVRTDSGAPERREPEEMAVEQGQALRERIIAQVRTRLADREAFVCDLDIAGTQTLCANAAHESSGIHTIDSGYVSRMPHKDSTKTVIADIDEVTSRAFEEEKLFSEIPVPWARPGRPVNVRDYTEFKGPAGC